MKRVLRALAWVVGGIAGLAVIAAGAVYGISEKTIRHTYDVPLRNFSASTDSNAVAEGERLARLRGCFGGCHGHALEGDVFFNEPSIAVIPAPNLTKIVREYTDPELERVIRHGVRPNGRSVVAMPSPMFAGLADEDLAKIIAFLRSQPLMQDSLPRFHVGLLGRIGVVTGQYTLIADEVEATPIERVPRDNEVAW